jgi:phosphopantothenoylcysteine decarboxylase/phosphopantothenate--cysteine ligase
MLTGKKILIGITGSIAAYKSILIVRLLVKAGAEVKVVMSPVARDFVSPLVLSTLSKNEVTVDFVREGSWANHVMLGRWADVFLIAPLSCNTLAKMAGGVCDNLLLAIYLSATCPVVVAPAMDEDMWHHPSAKRNVEVIKNDGIRVVEVEKGELASGLYGEGRMAEPDAIIRYLTETFFRGDRYQGKKVLVTAGPTYEALDPVRFIGNYSSGKMGFAIAEEFYMQGADVVLITGVTTEKVNYSGIQVIRVNSSEDMFNACVKYFEGSWVTVMSAAVADYKPVNTADKKIKKKEDQWQLQLTRTTDILQYLGNHKKQEQFIAGFALETDNESENAIGKLKDKKIDCIILNSLKDKNAGFGFDTNKITIMDRSGKAYLYDLKSKKEVAKDIVSYITSDIYGK